MKVCLDSQTSAPFMLVGCSPECAPSPFIFFLCVCECSLLWRRWRKLLQHHQSRNVFNKFFKTAIFICCRFSSKSSLRCATAYGFNNFLPQKSPRGKFPVNKISCKSLFYSSNSLSKACPILLHHGLDGPSVVEQTHARDGLAVENRFVFPQMQACIWATLGFFSVGEKKNLCQRWFEARLMCMHQCKHIYCTHNRTSFYQVIQFFSFSNSNNVFNKHDMSGHQKKKPHVVLFCCATNGCTVTARG